MGKTILCLCIFLICVRVNSNAQSHWVKFYVEGLSNETLCRNLESSLNAKEGIASVRAVSYDGNVLVFIKENYLITTNELRTWIAEAGFQPRCDRTGIIGVDKIITIRKTDCLTEPDKQ